MVELVLIALSDGKDENLRKDRIAPDDSDGVTLPAMGFERSVENAKWNCQNQDAPSR